VIDDRSPEKTIADLAHRRPLRRPPNDHKFGSLSMLAVTAGAFLLVALGPHEETLQKSPIR
jgi:hypothetical protein